MELKKIENRVHIDLENGTTYESNLYEIDEHYQVEEIIRTSEDGREFKNYNVMFTTWVTKYIPNIYYHLSFFGEEKPNFKIQTTSYGALNPDEVKKIIEGYQEAVEVVDILTKAFC